MLKVLTRTIVILAVVGLAVGGAWYLRNRSATAQTATTGGTYTQVVAAKRGDLSSSLTVVGELSAVQQADLAFDKLSSSTALKTLNVAAGNTVKAGDLLASVDPAAYQQALDQAKSDLVSAEETLADLEIPATETEIAEADQAVAEAGQDLAEAQVALAELQSPDASSIRQLQDAINNAQESLELARLQSNMTEIDSTAASLRNAEYLVKWHERKVIDLEKIVATGKANKEQTELLAEEQEALSSARVTFVNAQTQRRLALDSAEATIVAAEATLADAREDLADAKTGGDALELAKAQLTIKTAEVALATAQAARAQLDEGADATELANARASVEKARLALADAEAALAGTSLLAPFDGTILQVQVRQGALISANTTILTIADLDQLEVIASVDETSIKNVLAGQVAQVTFDALPGQTLQGVVGAIPLQGTLQGDVMVYEVPVELQGAEGLPLLVGMTANVAISTGEAADALLVPTMALTKSDGMVQVQVADPANPSASPQAVPVQIGLSNGTYTQITAGLNEGDQVVFQVSSDSASDFPMGGGMIMMMDMGGGGQPPAPPQGAGGAGPAGRQ